MLAIAALLLGGACGDPVTTPVAVLAQPSDFVAAGPGLPERQPEYLFVANAADDVVTVLQLDREVTALTWAPAPAVYHPLRLPAGRAPSALAASEDGTLVLVASGLDGALALIDAVGLRLLPSPQDATRPWALPVGTPGAQLGQLLPAGACGLGCDRFWALDLTGVAYELELAHQLDAEGRPAQVALAVGRALDLGPAPARLALSPDGAQLWVARREGSAALRIDLLSGARAELELGGPQSDLTLSSRGTLLFAALPLGRAVAVVRDPAGAMERVDQRARFLALDAASDFPDLFLGESPQRLLLAGDRWDGSTLQRVTPDLTVTCSDDETTNTDVYDQYLVTASLRGGLQFIVPAGEGGSFALADSSACRPPAVDGATDLLAWLAPCDPATRPGVCLTDSGLVLYPGYSATTQWQLRWQGDLTADQGAKGGGAIDAAGRFSMAGAGLDAEGLSVRAADDGGSDTLTILSAPLADPADCRAQYGQAGDLARRTFAIAAAQDDLLTLSQPLRPECFASSAAGLGFAVRARGALVLYGALQSETELQYYLRGRIAPGQAFGVGSDNGGTVLLSLRARPDLCAAPGACADDDGPSFTTSAPSSPVVAGDFGAGTTAGRSPVALDFIPIDGGQMIPLFALYAASDLLFAQISFVSGDLLRSGTYYYVQ